MIGLGILLGGIGALSISRAFRVLLFGVSANDVATLVSAVAVLAVGGLIAMWVPLQRAISVDPMQALRYE